MKNDTKKNTWVDEYAYIAAAIEFPSCNVVTVVMDKVKFKRKVKQGTILKFVVERTRAGNTFQQPTGETIKCTRTRRFNFGLRHHVKIP